MPENTTAYQDRLAALRQKIAEMGLDGFILPRTDEYQGEFLAACAERVTWLTGFTGSAGTVVVLKESRAVVLTDGRYTLQVEREVDPALYETQDSTRVTPAQWIARNADDNARIGFDPWLHTPAQIEAIYKAVSNRIALKPVPVNPLDAIWTDRPGKPMNPAEPFPHDVAGSDSQAKRAELAVELKEKGADALLLTACDSICWLLNVRGRDVLYTPLVQSHALLHADGSLDWFIDPRKVPPAILAHVGQGVSVIPPDNMTLRLGQLAGRKVMFDRDRSPVWFEQRLDQAGAVTVAQKDPVEPRKAIKSDAESAAVKEAHIRDAIAMIQLLHELDREAIKGRLTEIEVDEKIQQYRIQQGGYQGPSFATIAGFAGNGAVIHYRAAPETNARIEPPGLLLIDSGGQYSWGTTDITRTVAIGQPTPEMRLHYTLVLKGHIALSRARFPEGTTGVQLDTLARQHLWDAGLDFAHGTGHGVGCYLGVHEGPVSISPRGREPLKAGMLLTNEPGYYRAGEYGIRIENIMQVRVENEVPEGPRLLGFRTLTLVPYDPRLILMEEISEDERRWLRAYYLDIEEMIGPLLRPETRKWLTAQTAIIMH